MAKEAPPVEFDSVEKVLVDASKVFRDSPTTFALLQETLVTLGELKPRLARAALVVPSASKKPIMGAFNALWKGSK